MASLVTVYSDILLGQIIYYEAKTPEYNNLDMFQRYNVSIQDEMLPQFILFKNYSRNIIVYQDTIDALQMGTWLIYNSIYLGCDGCILQFDELVSQFMYNKNYNNDKISHNIGEKGSDILNNIIQTKNKDGIKFARYYMKTMSNIIKNGEAYISNEINRLNGLIVSQRLDGNPNAKRGFDQRINILEVFRAAISDDNTDSKREL